MCIRIYGMAASGEEGEAAIQPDKREAYAELHSNLARLQEATSEFSQHFKTVVAVADGSRQMATHFRDSMRPLPSTADAH